MKPSRRLLRRERDERDAARRRREQSDMMRLRRAAQIAAMHAEPLRRQERSFEMNAEHAGLAAACSSSTARCGRDHLLVRVGDERRQQRGRAEFAMRVQDRRDRLRRRRVVEQNIAAAIHLNVDEARREPGARRQLDDARAARTSRRGVSATMSSSSISTAQSRCADSPSKTTSAAIARRLVAHRVRVTFCRWRGRSTSTPRAAASRADHRHRSSG